MAQGQTVLVNFRLDEKDKERMEKVCNEIGLSMSAAFTIYAKKVGKEKRIPFELNADPFYSDENMRRLAKAAKDVNAGINIKEHKLIEEN